MVMETEIKATIVAGVDKNSFNDGINVARDTGKKIDQELKRKLQLDVVSFQLQLDQARQKLKQAKKEGDKDAIIKAQLNVNGLQSGLTEAKRQLNNLLNTGDQTTSRLQAKFNQLGVGIKNAFSKVGGALASLGIVSFFRGVIDEAVEAQRQVAQMNAAIKSTGGTVGLTGKEIQQMNTDLGKMNGLDNDVIASTSNMLLTFTQVRGDTFKEATQSIIDMATAMNGGLLPSSEQLAKSSIQVGKALNDPIKGITALKKVGVTFTEEQKKQIDNFVKGGQVAKAQAIILAELNKEFGGSAAAQMNTYGGAMNSLKLSMGEMKEAIGNALIPALQRIIGIMGPVIESIKAFIEQNPKLASVLGISTIAVTALSAAVAFLGGPFTLIIAGVVALTGGVIGATNAFNKMTETIRKVRSGVQDANGNLTDYGKKVQQIEKEVLGYKSAQDYANSSLQAFNKIKVNQNATRAEFESTRKDAIKAAEALIYYAKSLIAVSTTAQNTQKQISGGGFSKEFGGIGAIIKGNITQATKTVSEQMKILNDVQNTKFTGGGGLVSAVSESTKGATKSANEMKKAFEDAFVKISSDIDASASKIEGYKKEVDDLKLSIDNLGKKKEDDIASRVSSIDQELAKTGEQAVSAEERAKLEKERAEAFIGLNEKEIESLNAKIAAQTAYNALTDIGKIKADYEEEKATLDAKLVEAQTRLATEEAYYKSLKDSQAKMDADYTAKYKANIASQISSNNALITSYQSVAAAARAAASAMASAGGGGGGGSIPGRAVGGPVAAGSPYIVGERGPELFVPHKSGNIVPNNQLTNNINISANVSNNIELDYLANQLAKKIALSRKGIF